MGVVPMSGWRRSQNGNYLGAIADGALAAPKSGAGDWEGPWLRCSIGDYLWFQILWTADAGTTFTLGLQGTVDRLRSAASIITLPAATDGIYGTWPTVLAAADTAAIVIRTPFPEMRCIGVGSGGVADQFTGFYEIKK